MGDHAKGHAGSHVVRQHDTDVDALRLAKSAPDVREVWKNPDILVDPTANNRINAGRDDENGVFGDGTGA